MAPDPWDRGATLRLGGGGGGGTRHFFLLKLYNFQNIGGGGHVPTLPPPPPSPYSAVPGSTGRLKQPQTNVFRFSAGRK